jgi:hypothetical protein
MITALKYISALYRIEKEAKQNNLTLLLTNASDKL